MTSPKDLYAAAHRWALRAGFTKPDASRWAQLSAIRPASTRAEQGQIATQQGALLRKYGLA